MYDPNAYVLGTELSAQSIYQKNDAKGNQLRSERFNQIEKENKTLYEKMLQIANKPHYSTISHEEPPRYSNQLTKNKMASRIRKLKQIEQENHAFLDRLHRVSSTYSVTKWEHERKQVESQLDSGLHGKFQPHVFRADEVVKKQKMVRE